MRRFTEGPMPFVSFLGSTLRFLFQKMASELLTELSKRDEAGDEAVLDSVLLWHLILVWILGNR